MNQTKKRLSIINLAISITDIETIQLQITQLSLLKSDLKIGEIIATLKEENYAQSQGLITEYIEAPNETIVQRTSQENTIDKEKAQALKKEEEQAIIEEFDLFTTPAYESSQDTQEEVNYDAFLETETTSEEAIDKEVNYDPLLNVVANDILPNNIDLDISENSENTLVKNNNEISSNTSQINTDEKHSDIPIRNEKVHQNTKNTTISPKDSSKDISEEEYTSYDAIPHIDTKFNNLYEQYPPIEHSETRYDSVENWLRQISSEGYTETEVETQIKAAHELKNTNLQEAAQLLISTSSTDSLYGLFQLARALFTGDILQKNIPEAVTLIHYLAISEEYPEAMCDLAQFYEQGIEVKQDSKKAEALYKKAMDLGIQRASKHYTRIQDKPKSIFPNFTKKL